MTILPLTDQRPVAEVVAAAKAARPIRIELHRQGYDTILSGQGGGTVARSRLSLRWLEFSLSRPRFYCRMRRPRPSMYTELKVKEAFNQLMARPDQLCCVLIAGYYSQRGPGVS